MSRLASQDWIDAAVQKMATSGVHAIRVESLAKELGVSKGSFYWHFANRKALLTKMLEYWHEYGTQAVIAHNEAQDRPPLERLQTLLALMFESTPTELAFELQVRAWATTDDEIQATVQSVDVRRVQYVERLMADAKVPCARARSKLLYSMFLGDMLRQSYGGTKIDRGQLRLLSTFVTNT